MSNTDKPSATTTAVTERGVKFFEVSSPLLCAHRVRRANQNGDSLG
ncbi:MAG: hypothetical protein FWG77_01395 [Treponema sp.]|nr:hypothetical protein [Treponema sp.]